MERERKGSHLYNVLPDLDQDMAVAAETAVAISKAAFNMHGGTPACFYIFFKNLPTMQLKQEDYPEKREIAEKVREICEVNQVRMVLFIGEGYALEIGEDKEESVATLSRAGVPVSAMPGNREVLVCTVSTPDYDSMYTAPIDRSNSKKPVIEGGEWISSQRRMEGQFTGFFSPKKGKR